MFVENLGGLPRGDTDSPILLAEPRGGVPDVIDTPEALSTAVHLLSKGHGPLGLDVERAQGFRYGADPYLLQIRRENVGSFLIDTKALPDLSRMSEVMADTWILHDASQDLPNLRQLGLDTRDLFDTEIAARLIGIERFGLAAVCEQVLGLALIKDHQNANWSIRPLPKDWLRYAVLDVELLPELHRRLSLRLHELDRWEWALEEFAHVVMAPPPPPKIERWRSLPGASRLPSSRERAVLRALWHTREEIAQTLDLSPGRLLRNSALVRAAAQPPRNRRSLLTIGEFRSPVARKYTDQWLRSINRAVNLPPDLLPPKRRELPAGSMPESRMWSRIDPQAHERLTRVRAVVAELAADLGIAPEVLLEPKVQRQLAWVPLDSSVDASREVGNRLDNSRARNWQKALVAAPLTRALS